MARTTRKVDPRLRITAAAELDESGEFPVNTAGLKGLPAMVVRKSRGQCDGEASQIQVGEDRVTFNAGEVWTRQAKKFVKRMHSKANRRIARKELAG